MNKTLKYLTEEFRKNRTVVWIYLGICILLCVLSGPIMMEFGPGGTVFASEEPLSTKDTISQLVALFTTGTFTALAGSYSSIIGVSVEPFAGLLFIGIMENVNKWCGSPLTMYSTPMGNPVVLAIVAVFFIASKVMKANESTKVIGNITLGEVEEKLGLVFALVLGITNVIGITNVALGGTPVNASNGSGVPASTVIVAIISALYAVIMSIITMIVYFVVKTVARGIDIIQATVTTFIPGSGLVFEIAKTVIVDVLIFVNIIFPPVGIAINVIIFIICLILFSYFYPVGKYFNVIYVKSFWKRIGHFDSEIPLVPKKYPKKIRKLLGEELATVDLFIPIYILKIDKKFIKIKKYRKMYLCHKADGNFLLKPARKFKKMQLIPFEKAEKDNIYLQKHFRYFEVFRYWPYEKNLERKHPAKAFSVVFSREYLYKHEEIVNITGFENFNAIKGEEKYNQKMLRKELKEQRELEYEMAEMSYYNSFDSSEEE